MSKAWRVFLWVVLMFFGSSLWAQGKPFPEITNIDEIATALKLEQFKDKSFGKKIKIAILDNGFTGYEQKVGKSLPQATFYHQGKASAADDSTTEIHHGLFMAQIVAGLISKSGAQADYELHLFNAKGYTKFVDAVDNVVAGNFDVVLYSQVWEYGGNGDGQGYINAVVTKAVDAGIIWVNAAGNFGRMTRLAPVMSQSDGTNEWVVFGDNGENVTFECSAPEGQQCQMRLALSWNDFKNNAVDGADKDLDLYIYDSKDNLVLSSERNQMLVADANDKLATIFPRELIEGLIDTGTYRVAVKNRSKNFSADKDQLRLNLFGSHLTLNNPSIGETLIPPADHPGVLVVGASDDLQTNVSKKWNKPDINLKSRVNLDDETFRFSTSTASAMVAAMVVLHLGTGVEKTLDAVRTALLPISQKLPEEPAEGGGSPQNEPARQPEHPEMEMPEDSYDPVAECLRPLPIDGLYSEARQLLIRSEVELVRLRGRVSVAVYGPLSRYFDLSYLDDDQRLFVTPEGLRILGPEDWINGLHRSVLEIHRTRIPFCENGEPSWMK